MKVPFLDLKAQYASIKKDVDLAIQSVLESTEFIGGKALRDFEAKFAAAHGAKHCIGVGNGTDALVVALKALGIGPGDSVVTAANSFIATSEAVTLAGARTVFVDCAADYNLDVAALSRALDREKKNGHKVRAIVPVHLYGRACDMTAIGELAKTHDCVTLEDCAQAHLAQHAGRTVGTFGAAGSFSFYPGKNLGAYGDAGALVTNDDALAERMRMYANHGRKDKYDHLFEGTNSRLDNLQAAVLGVKLAHLADWTTARIAVAERYRARLAGENGIEVPAKAQGLGHVYHLFVVRVKNRDVVRAHLKEQGIDTGVHYPIALPNLAAYKHLGVDRKDIPNASAFESEILSLPIFPEMTHAQIDWVSECLRKAVH
jgi:dTDP-4-amino-4,6-dideoxygalactose transaminase